MDDDSIKVGDVVAWEDVPWDTLVAVTKRRLFYRESKYGRTLLGRQLYDWSSWKPRRYKCTVVMLNYMEQPTNVRESALCAWLK